MDTKDETFDINSLRNLLHSACKRKNLDSAVLAAAISIAKVIDLQSEVERLETLVNTMHVASAKRDAELELLKESHVD